MTPETNDVAPAVPSPEAAPAQQRPVAPDPPPTPDRPSRGWLRPLVGIGIVAIAAAIAVLFSARWDAWVGARIDQTTDDAYVKGDITPLSAKIEGYVQKVAVNDYQSVKAGDLLCVIQPASYAVRRLLITSPAAMNTRKTPVMRKNRPKLSLRLPKYRPAPR